MVKGKTTIPLKSKKEKTMFFLNYVFFCQGTIILKRTEYLSKIKFVKKMFDRFDSKPVEPFNQHPNLIQATHFLPRNALQPQKFYKRLFHKKM